jgi:hypothetical protein
VHERSSGTEDHVSRAVDYYIEASVFGHDLLDRSIHRIVGRYVEFHGPKVTAVVSIGFLAWNNF